MKLCGFDIGLSQPFFLIAGPCVVESEQLQMDTAGTLKEITASLGIPFIFKSSYDKANRSSGTSFRGPGMEKGLEILAKVKRELHLSILTDVHSEAEIAAVAAVVDDMRSLAIMRETQAPVVFDATHSVQLPGGNGTSSGGQREMVPVLARAAVAVGIAGLFMETHPDPAKAMSDGPNAVPLKHMKALLETLLELDRVTKRNGFLENNFQ